MNMKKLTLASAIMLALTGCGSSGGGSSNPTPNAEVNNNHTTQTQVQQQKAEVEALKKQLAQAQANQKQAEDKLKAAEQTQNKDLTEAKKNLASAQENLTQAQSALKQAESQSSANQKAKDALQKQLNQAEQSLSKAQQEKLLAEKELNNKLAQDKTMTRAEVLDFALHSGLYAGDSEEFANNFQNKPKSYVIDQLLDTHKRIAIKRLARSYGLPEADVRIFAKENQSKTLDESTKILESKREEIAQKREALSKEIFELAKAKGLEEFEAYNFAYHRQHADKEEALKELNQYVTEKAERETKINELINLAKEKGLEEYEAQNFANENIDNDREQARKKLDQAVNRKKIVNELIQLAKEKGLEEWDAQSFANNNAENDQKTAVKNLEQFIIDRATEKADEIKRRIGENIPQGFTAKYDDKAKPIYDNKAQEIGRTKNYKDIYNQKYSIIAARYESYEEFQYPESARKDYTLTIQAIDGRFGGFKTEVLPTRGNATYKGKAFTVEREGDLTYSVDFDKREGKGEITGLKDLGTLHLNKGDVVRPFNDKNWGWGVNSSMTAEEWKDQNMKGQYQLFFYGPNAEEIAGVGELVQEQSDKNTKKLSEVIPTSGWSGGPSSNLLTDLPYTSPNDPNGPFGVDVGFGGTLGEIQK